LNIFATFFKDKIIVFLRFSNPRWFSLGTPVSSTNKTDSHDIIEILLKVALNIINLSINLYSSNPPFVVAGFALSNIF
jgi:hypothetical protein